AEPFDQNELIAAVGGRQLPNPGAGPIASHSRLYNYPDYSFTRTIRENKSHGFKMIFLSNTFAAYKKDALQSIGYFGMNQDFGEDTIACAKLLQKGYHIHYQPSARVIHSHDHSIRYEMKRYFQIGKLHKKKKLLFDAFDQPFGEGLRFLASELKYLVRYKVYFQVLLQPIRIMFRTCAYFLGRFTAKADNHIS
ncbi:MAG: glycosyltransferase family 2 protein, partial [Proteobacteria bacterium]|nr:glycosyltransferase family 2 protein [Pseudomonadota bacterium]